MNNSNQFADRVQHFVSTLSNYRMWLIIPTVVCTLLAVGFAILKPNHWSASQSLVIRDDLVGRSFKPGRFESLESLKSAQETVLEIARKPQVIRNALDQLGPPTMMIGKSRWPTESMIETVQGQVTIAAPNGAEFGKTEVILLNTKSSTRDRARKFISIMMDEIDSAMGQVRAARIESMSSELQQSVDAARASFDISAKSLQAMDTKFGADLGTLRGLNLQTSGDGSLQKTITEIRGEQRRALEEVDLQKKQREILLRSLEDPGQYLVTSSELLTMQPRLEQLVAGLSSSQLELASMSGKFTDQHTEVISAKRAIRDIKKQILREVQAAIHGLSAQVEFGETRIEKLVAAEEEFEARLSGLSDSRVGYDKLEQEVKKKSEVLGQARQDLAEVQSLAGSNANLLTRVGQPQVATRSDPPGKKAIIGAGLLGGLAIGMGLIMFLAPPFAGDDETANLLPPPDPNAPNRQPGLLGTETNETRSGLPGAVPIGIGASPAVPASPVATAVSRLTPILADGIAKAKQHIQKNVDSVKESLAEHANEISSTTSEKVGAKVDSTTAPVNKQLVDVPAAPVKPNLLPLAPPTTTKIEIAKSPDIMVNDSITSQANSIVAKAKRKAEAKHNLPLTPLPETPDQSETKESVTHIDFTNRPQVNVASQVVPPVPAANIVSPAVQATSTVPSQNPASIAANTTPPPAKPPVTDSPAPKETARRSNVQPIDLSKVVKDLERESKDKAIVDQVASSPAQLDRPVINQTGGAFIPSTPVQRGSANTVQVGNVNVEPNPTFPKNVKDAPSVVVPTVPSSGKGEEDDVDEAEMSADEIVRLIRARQGKSAAKPTANPANAGTQNSANADDGGKNLFLSPSGAEAPSADDKSKLDVRRRAQESLEKAIESLSRENE